MDKPSQGTFIFKKLESEIIFKSLEAKYTEGLKQES
jgi:hypothetical protein